MWEAEQHQKQHESNTNRLTQKLIGTGIFMIN